MNHRCLRSVLCCFVLWRWTARLCIFIIFLHFLDSEINWINFCCSFWRRLKSTFIRTRLVEGWDSSYAYKSGLRPGDAAPGRWGWRGSRGWGGRKQNISTNTSRRKKIKKHFPQQCHYFITVRQFLNFLTKNFLLHYAFEDASRQGADLTTSTAEMHIIWPLWRQIFIALLRHCGHNQSQNLTKVFHYYHYILMHSEQMREWIAASQQEIGTLLSSSTSFILQAPLCCEQC